MRIDIYTDIACPWCYIGERRLRAALARRPDLHVERHWRPFQLQPSLPEAGMPWADFARQKFGGPERARAAFAYVARAAVPDGITFRFDRMPKAPNTVNAHRLILFAGDRAWDVADALFAAYFTHGRDLTDLDELAAIAGENGLDEEAARAYLRSEEGRAAVVDSQQQAERLGIQGVPFFVFEERYGLSGAQPVDTFVQALDAVDAEATAS